MISRLVFPRQASVGTSCSHGESDCQRLHNFPRVCRGGMGQLSLQSQSFPLCTFPPILLCDFTVLSR
ncbi:MAG TPA: hypothetical protein VF352_01640 [Anaerolineales bacterium]